MSQASRLREKERKRRKYYLGFQTWEQLRDWQDHMLRNMWCDFYTRPPLYPDGGEPMTYPEPEST